MRMNINETNFIQEFLKVCERKNLKEMEARNLAGIEKYNFSKYQKKLYSNPDYLVPRESAIRLALGTKPETIDEINELLSKAGYVLSNNFEFDRAIINAIKNRRYRWVAVNSELKR